MISIISCCSDFCLNKKKFTFFVEAVDSGDGGGLVVAAEDVYFFGVLDFVGEQETDGLDALSPPVNIVSEEKVVGLRREASILEQS